MLSNRARMAPTQIGIALAISGLLTTIAFGVVYPATEGSVALPRSGLPLSLSLSLIALIVLITALLYTRVRHLVRALRVSEQRLQSALQVSDSHVWDFDFRSDCILASPSLRAQLGFAGPPQPVPLARWRHWVHPDDLAPPDQPDATRALLLQDRGVEVRVLDSDNRYHWYYFRGGVVETDMYGKPLRALGTATDIHARKEMEQQLIAARIAADDANHAKSLFLSSMSHELRTPLNGVLGYAQILLDSPGTSPEQQRQLSAIESCGQHLLALINDVLDLSKIESGNVEIKANNCNLFHLLESVSDIVRQRAHSKGLQFSLEIDKSVPPFIYIDDVKLRQILVNLLGNAVKFTQQGTVALRVATRVVSSSARELIFQVRDTGVGIAPEQQQEIFQPFRQVGRSAGGTGLGLSISQRLSEAMGGMLLVQSNLGAGSCFSLSLPLTIGEIAKTPNSFHFSHPTLDTAGAAITVLIADDNPINRQVLSSMMRANGIAVVEAENGSEALERIRQHKLRQQDIALVLMDVRMPVMDGFAATRAIKSDPELWETKVIVVSASVSPDTIAHMKEVGCDDFIKKPVRVRELLEKVAEQLQLPLREAAPSERENQSS